MKSRPFFSVLRHRLQNAAGFTLAEIMAAAGIGAVAISIAALQYIGLLDSTNSFNNKMTLLSIRQNLTNNLVDDGLVQRSLEQNLLFQGCLAATGPCPPLPQNLDLLNEDGTVFQSNTSSTGWDKTLTPCDLATDAGCVFKEQYFFSVLCGPPECVHVLVRVDGRLDYRPQGNIEMSSFDFPPIARMFTRLDPTALPGVVIAGGLTGTVYYMSHADALKYGGGPGIWASNTLWWQEIKDKGTLLPSPIHLANLDVPPVSFSNQGLPMSNGEIMKDISGNILENWYALDLAGKITMPPGTYQFLFAGDDGVKITINGSVIMNKDRVVWPYEMTCSTNLVTFAPNEVKDIRVQYFQGPPNTFGLTLSYMATSVIGPCQSVGYTVVPASAFPK